MKIADIIASPGLTGFYFDDQKAIKRGDCGQDGFTYAGKPLTEGFSSIRQAGESISIQIVLDDGQVAYGDCAAVQYSGCGGRDPLFLADEYMPIILEQVRPLLVGQSLHSFRHLAESVDSFRREDGKLLHTASRYGITQALLDAVARAKRKTMAEVIAEEYQVPLHAHPVPIFCQTGDERYINADRIIIKRADVLPHGLFNNVAKKLGYQGEKLLDYVKWLRKRVQQLGQEGYVPTFHLDVYGTIGEAFNNDLPRIAQYLEELKKAAGPHTLRIEGPIDWDNKADQIKGLSELRQIVDRRGIDVQIVADEWCNTLEDIKDFTSAKAGHLVQIKTPDLGGINNSIEAVIYCKENGMGAYLGGTCNETDRSAQSCVHVAVATQPCQMLAKPGMGVDEGLQIVKNEMGRLIALLKWKQGGTD